MRPNPKTLSLNQKKHEEEQPSESIAAPVPEQLNRAQQLHLVEEKHYEMFKCSGLG